MSVFDLTVLAPLISWNDCVRNKSVIEESNNILKSPTSTDEVRHRALSLLLGLSLSKPDKVTLYHQLCAIHLLSIHSTEGPYKRKTYASKCASESKKKIAAIEVSEKEVNSLYNTRMDYRMDVQLFLDLKKKAEITIQKIEKVIKEAREKGTALDEQYRKGNLKKRGALVKKMEKTRYAKKRKLNLEDDGQGDDSGFAEGSDDDYQPVDEDDDEGGEKGNAAVGGEEDI